MIHVFALSLLVVNSALCLKQGSIYDGCNEVKGCVGSVEGCIETQDCQLIATWAVADENGYKFEVQAQWDGISETDWVGVALGTDFGPQTMGEDSAVICHQNAGEEPHFEMYWNQNPDGPYGAYGSIPLDDPEVGVRDGSLAFENGALTCSFTRDAVVTITKPMTDTEVTIDINENPYNIMVASGAMSADDPELIGPHKVKVQTMSLENIGDWPGTN